MGTPISIDDTRYCSSRSFLPPRVGRGTRVLFWLDRRIEGRSILDLAPGVWNKVPVRRRNKRTVEEALNNNNWLKDLTGEISLEEATQIVGLWMHFLAVVRDEAAEDVFHWPWSKHGAYTTSSTYHMLLLGQEGSQVADWIWRCKAIPKCKIFM